MTREWLWECRQAEGHAEQVHPNGKGTKPAAYESSRGDGSGPPRRRAPGQAEGGEALISCVQCRIRLLKVT